MSWRDWKGKERGKRRERAQGSRWSFRINKELTREPSLTYSTRKYTWKREAKKSIQREK